jgi:hypothetical protein
MNRRPTRVSILMLGLGLFLAAAPGVRAASWWRLPVWGAEIRVFAIDPFQRQVIYCGTSRGNFYGSTDAGASWTPLRQGAAFPGYVATGLVADPDVRGRLWASLAGQYQGGLVARSDDGGENWTVLARWKVSVATRALAVGPVYDLDTPEIDHVGE